MNTVHFFIALVAGLLLWRDARADVPRAPASRAPTEGACRFGEVPPCSGTEEELCVNGRVERKCCPEGATCNFDTGPFVGCGHGYCIDGRDPGLCPPKPVRRLEASDQAACEAEHGEWEPACINGQIKPACFPPMKTNYNGPNPNPPYLTCGTSACTTTLFPEDCYPIKTDGATCEHGWTKVCLMGRITERCIPAGAERSDASQRFTPCGTDRCIIGTEALYCPAP